MGSPQPCATTTVQPTDAPSDIRSSTTVSTTTHATSTTNPSTTPITLRCGSNWSHANSNCGVACLSGTDAECPGNQRCFRDLSPQPCATTTVQPTDAPSDIRS